MNGRHRCSSDRRELQFTALAAVLAACAGLCAAAATDNFPPLPYAVTDTGQTNCYNNTSEIPPPSPGEPFFGQDAQYAGPQPAWHDNGDGTISDLVTGLMWTPVRGRKLTWTEALEGAAACRVGGHSDWRLPTIKELYSLILFSGLDPDPRAERPHGVRPFIAADLFGFEYGRPDLGERIIDAQYVSSTLCASPVMDGLRAAFGVNFADGRIKAYPIRGPGPREKRFAVLYVRGNPAYGRNDFVANGDGTVTDRATGLTWAQRDSGRGMTWEEALRYAETFDLAGYDDWRLPNAKELHTLVDYSRSPDSTGSAAIAPVFETTVITNEAGQADYPYFWTSTTHARPGSGASAVYIAFGRAPG